MAELFRVSATAEDCGNVSRAGHGGGASYFFCERALSKSLNTTEALGLSFGIFTWDAWGEAMAKRFSLQTKLFDCYTTQAETPALGSKWAVKPQREDACVAGSSFTDKSGRVFRPLGAYLAGRPPRGTAVKMDVEGSEWDALSAASDEELRMIDHLDMELHFCLPSTGWPLAQKVAVLKRLDRFFKVVNKFWDDSYFQGFSDSAVCDKKQKNALGRSFPQMLSISYVNRELTASG